MLIRPRPRDFQQRYWSRTTCTKATRITANGDVSIIEYVGGGSAVSRSVYRISDETTDEWFPAAV